MTKLKRCLCLIALGLMLGTPAQAYEFQYDDLLFAYMKLYPNFDYDSYVDDYMQLYRNPVWTRSHSDEFEMQKARDETLKIMKDNGAKFKTDEPFHLTTQANFGEYDFKAGKFDMNPLGIDTVFTSNPNCCVQNLKAMKVSFSNPDVISGLPMSADDAKTFLEHHKSGGMVNRSLNVNLSFVVKEAKEDNEMLAEIVKYTVTDPAKQNAVLLAWPAGSAAATAH